MGRTIHQFKIPTNHLFNLVIFNLIWNPYIQVLEYNLDLTLSIQPFPNVLSFFFWMKANKRSMIILYVMSLIV